MRIVLVVMRFLQDHPEASLLILILTLLLFLLFFFTNACYERMNKRAVRVLSSKMPARAKYYHVDRMLVCESMLALLAVIDRWDATGEILLAYPLSAHSSFLSKFYQTHTLNAAVPKHWLTQSPSFEGALIHPQRASPPCLWGGQSVGRRPYGPLSNPGQMVVGLLGWGAVCG